MGVETLLELRDRARRDVLTSVFPADRVEAEQALDAYTAYTLATVLPQLLFAVSAGVQQQTVGALKRAGALKPGIAEQTVTEAVRQATESTAQEVVVRLGEQTQRIVTRTQEETTQGLLDALVEAGVLAAAEVTT